MGNDGGTIAKRQDILSFHRHQAGNTKNTDVIQSDGLIVCSISSLSLKDEIVVADYLGKLYIKEKIIEYMLNRNKKENSGVEGDFPSTLNDIIELELHWLGDNTIVCPVTGSSRDLCYLRPCGCVVSYKLLQELHNNNNKKKQASDAGKGKSNTSQGESNISANISTCPNCEKGFAFEYDIVLINHTDEFNKRNYEYLTTHLKLHHNKKPIKEKKKKRRRNEVEGEDKGEKESKRQR